MLQPPHTCPSAFATRRRAVWILTAIMIAAQVGAVALAGPAGRSPLVGRVLGPDGQSVGRARVFIYTASVREGTSTLCPSCYPECGKSATTDRDGRFSIPGLSDSLRFRVLAVARGFEPVFAEHVDPLEGPIDIRIARRRSDEPDPEHSLRGRVIDPLGRPVVGAVLTPYGYRKELPGGGFMKRFGPSAGTDPLAISDDRGEFSLALGDSGVRWYIRVTSRDLAPMLLSEQPAQAKPIRVAMRYGGTVTGRVTWQDKPLPGACVGLVQADRSAEQYVYPAQTIACDERGVFTFVNVPAGRDYFVHGVMERLADFGALDTTRVHVPGDDTFRNAGDLALTPGRRIAGQVMLADGQPVPPSTRILLSFDAIMDGQNQVLGPEGRFEFRGVPVLDAGLTVRVRGYRLARESDGYSEVPGFPQCAVPVDRDAGNLRIVLEPGSEP